MVKNISIDGFAVSPTVWIHYEYKADGKTGFEKNSLEKLQKMIYGE